MHILVFGGTAEGRLIVEHLSAYPDVFTVACTATDYGAELLEPQENLQVIAARLDAGQMEELMRSQPFSCVVDATHPYAAEASAHIESAARACGLARLRVVREGEPVGPWIGAASVQEAAALAAAQPGNVLLTTGSKDLPTYVSAMPDYKERLYVRILPVASSLAVADKLEIPASHIVAMQGPFSFELNCALMRDLNIACMVTKASGAQGGFDEKVKAAAACAVQLIVVHRPTVEEGASLDEAYRYLDELIATHRKGALQ